MAELANFPPTLRDAGKKSWRQVFGKAVGSGEHETFGWNIGMTDSRTNEMVLVYDLRRDHRYRAQLLSGLDEPWKAYLRGEQPASTVEGRITELFYAPYEGEQMFRLDEGARQSSWARHGDESWYAVGRLAKVERVVFQAPHRIGDMPVVTRVWIGPDETKQ